MGMMTMRWPKPHPDPPWVAQNTAGYEAPAALAADVVLITVIEDEAQVALVGPKPDTMALPGTLVRPDETAAQGAQRALFGKAGVAQCHLEQLETFTDPRRDDRGWIPTVAHLMLVPPDTPLSGEHDPHWHPVRETPELAYDHNYVLTIGLDRIYRKLWWSNIAYGVLPEPFVMASARRVYEALASAAGHDVRYDPSTFARDLWATDLIDLTGELVSLPRGRPAQQYRFRSVDQIEWRKGRRPRVADRRNA